MLVTRIEVKDRKVGSLEIRFDDRMRRFFEGASSADNAEEAFTLRGILPLTITL